MVAARCCCLTLRRKGEPQRCARKLHFLSCSVLAVRETLVGGLSMAQIRYMYSTMRSIALDSSKPAKSGRKERGEVIPVSRTGWGVPDPAQEAPYPSPKADWDRPSSLPCHLKSA